ncbi:MAG: hypothetical protein O8C63_05685, partial [Candidatus Methanoperedens sp.]|nr:hypothetical protein [Candidatus Methanoperedens sp.]
MPVGSGFTDVIPRQIVRTKTDRLYIFAAQTFTSNIRCYWTPNTGLPNAAGDFSLLTQITTSTESLSIETIYDGDHIIHVLTNTRAGKLLDYPFDIASNSFLSPITLFTDSGTVVAGDYMGTSGVSGMIDLAGLIHISYWNKSNHIVHQAYVYDRDANTLTPYGDPTQVDASGNANHPALAISSADNSLTVAWISEASSPVRILARTRSSSGIWGNIEMVSTAPVWTSHYFGINIDQGPGLLITLDGIRHLTYIENFDQPEIYGRIHYAIKNGPEWVDERLNAYTNDPALAWNNSGEMYIIGHGHPLNPSCKSLDEICVIKRTSDGTWGSPQLFASPPLNQSFDSSPSVKWSVIGFNRPETIEFLFFVTPYQSPIVYYGRLAAILPTYTPTPLVETTATPTPAGTLEPTFTGTPTPTKTLVPTYTATPTPTKTLVPTYTATPTPTKTLVPTYTATPTPTKTLVPT